MQRVVWKAVQHRFCEKAKEEVALELRLVYPASILPDQPPRVIGHRCSLGFDCNQLDGPACMWAGTLPDFDPFA